MKRVVFIGVILATTVLLGGCEKEVFIPKGTDAMEVLIMDNKCYNTFPFGYAAREHRKGVIVKKLVCSGAEIETTYLALIETAQGELIWVRTKDLIK